MALIDELKLNDTFSIDKHPFYTQTVTRAEALNLHYQGEKPMALIEERRPCESDENKAYRLKIYKSKTKSPLGRVFTELGKIRKSKDWNISYNEDKVPQKAKSHPEGDLKQYCEKDFPNFSSLTNWVFEVLLRKQLIDTNAVVFVRPMETNVGETGLIKPYPYIYDSSQVIQFVHNDYAILELKKKDKQRYADYYVVDVQEYRRYRANAEGKYTAIEQYKHGLGYLPVFRMHGIVTDVQESDYINESRIATMVEHLDEAAREYSDLQIAKVMHMYPQKWQMSTQECTTCKGSGKVKEGTTSLSCVKCKGTGVLSLTPFQIIEVKAPEAGDTKPATTPPAGYINLPTEIIEIQEKSVAAHIYDGLAAVNMEYLADTPLNQSGTAKEVDRDSLNTFVNSVAEDTVQMMDLIYAITNDYRYGVLIENPEERRLMLPRVNVPDTFDLSSTNTLMNEVRSGEEAKLNPTLKGRQQIDYGRKKFASDPELISLLELSYLLDPLSGQTEEEKTSRLSNKGITEKAYVISSNITEFVTRALKEVDSFPEKRYVEQVKQMAKYADEVIKGNSNVSKVMDLANGEMDPAAVGSTLSTTVGGLTGIIDVSKAVAGGTLQKEAAIALVAFMFGVSEEQAAKFIGNPPQITSTEKAAVVSSLT